MQPFLNMAWDVNSLMGYFKVLTRKNQSGGISATDLFYNWNAEQYAYHSDLLGRWQARNASKEGTNTGLIQDETILTALNPFILSVPLTIASSNASKPSDFAYTTDLRRNDRSFLFITHDQIFSVNDSVIDPPTDVSPYKYYATEYQNYYYLLPQAMTGTVTLDYIKTCTDIVWAYIFDDDGRQVYVSSSITGVPVIFGGVGYTTPTIAFSAPAAGGVQATGTLTVVDGVITEVVMTNIGYGYAGLTPTYIIAGTFTTPANLGTPIVSVQPQWGQNDIVTISKRVLNNFGISYKDSDFLNAGRYAQTTGD